MVKKQELTKQKPEKTDEIIDILKKFRMALKSISFYPPNHGITKNNLALLLSPLSNYLNENEKLGFIVTKKGLILDDKNNYNIGFVDIANRLHKLKIRQLTIVSGVTGSELADLLAILCMSLDGISASGKITELMTRYHILHINIVEMVLDIVDISDHQPKKRTEPATKSNDELAKILNNRRNISLADSRVILIRMEQDPGDLARLLVDIVSANKSTRTGESASLFATLKRLDVVIARELPEKQNFIYNNLWEALQKLPDNLSEQLFSFIINNNMGEAEVSKQILSRLPTDKLAEIIIKSINKSGNSSATFNKLMERLPVDRQQFAEIFNSLNNKLPSEILEGAKLNQLADRKNDFYQRLEESLTEEQVTDIIAFCSENTNKREINDQLSDYRRRDTDDELVAILLDGLANNEDLNRFQTFLGRLRTYILDQVKSSHYQHATIILHDVKATADNIDSVEFKLEIKKAINNLCHRQLLSLFIDASVQDSSTLCNDGYLDFLNEIGAVATDMLLDMLAAEGAANRRLVICQLIAKINANNISYLAEKLHDQRWYFARNIVHILGIMKSETAVQYIETAIDYPENRVRLEAISALVNIGGSNSANLLTKLTNDNNEPVARAAIKGLSQIGDTQNLIALIHLLEKKDRFFRRTSANIEIINTLGKAGISEAAPLLTKLINKRSWLFKSKNRQRRQAAVKALANIERVQQLNLLNDEAPYE